MIHTSMDTDIFMMVVREKRFAEGNNWYLRTDRFEELWQTRGWRFFVVRRPSSRNPLFLEPSPDGTLFLTTLPQQLSEASWTCHMFVGVHTSSLWYPCLETGDYFLDLDTEQKESRYGEGNWVIPVNSDIWGNIKTRELCIQALPSQLRSEAEIRKNKFWKFCMSLSGHGRRGS